MRGTLKGITSTLKVLKIKSYALDTVLSFISRCYSHHQYLQDLWAATATTIQENLKFLHLQCQKFSIKTQAEKQINRNCLLK